MNIPSLRLRSQQIEQSRFKQPAEVVACLGALQGQDYAGAKWSVGLRLPGSTEAVIDAAIAHGDIARSWAMRGTLHLIAAVDLRWILALLAPNLIAGNARRYRQLELDEPTLAHSTAVITEALAERPLTRRDLLPILERAGISTAGQRGVYMLQRASLDGRVYQSLMPQHNNPLFNLLSDTLPAGPRLTQDEALAELARRFFTSRGPASFGDYQRWSGLPVKGARAGLKAVNSVLVEDSLGDETYWRAPSDAVDTLSSPSAHLLPGFDEYLLGYKNRSAVLNPQYDREVSPGGGVFRPTIVIDGQVVGTWRAGFKKDKVQITLAPFNRLSDSQMEAVEQAAQRYGSYLAKSTALV